MIAKKGRVYARIITAEEFSKLEHAPPLLKGDCGQDEDCEAVPTYVYFQCPDLESNNGVATEKMEALGLALCTFHANEMAMGVAVSCLSFLCKGESRDGVLSVLLGLMDYVPELSRLKEIKDQYAEEVSEAVAIVASRRILKEAQKSFLSRERLELGGEPIPGEKAN